MDRKGVSSSNSMVMVRLREKMSYHYVRLGLLVAGVLLACVACEMNSKGDAELSGPTFEVSFESGLYDGELDGRMVLMLAPVSEVIDDTGNVQEPRFKVSSGSEAIQICGIDIDGLAPGEVANIGPEAFCFPRESLADLPAGEYEVQALLHRYEMFELGTGHTVKLPMDRGEGQKWNRAPGNLYSTPRRLYIDPEQQTSAAIVLDSMIEPIEPPVDTKYVKHVRIQSDLLTEFWGRPMHLGAHVLLPEGFDDHPDVRYPLVVFHGHFLSDFNGFRPETPDPDLEPKYSKRFDLDGYNVIQQREAHDFYRRWTSSDFPRMLIVQIQHANPYYDDSYAVNSANLGPYGDAINQELIPYLEERFRGIGKGWARFTYGGSTGGWEALATQVFYPDMYNGAFAACPDPVDFRAYVAVDIYRDKNAYWQEGPLQRVARPESRDWLGHIRSTMQDNNHQELVLGTNARSGGQYDIWQAVYGPMGADGYPQPIWDKRTGVIDHEVAEYWRDNFDLRYILERDWATLGPKLTGKIHIYVGDMDNYYLNNAVYVTEEFLEGTTDPYYAGEVDYGDRAEHCWNGDQENPNHISRLRYNTLYVDKIVKRIEGTAPVGADLTSWRY